MDRPPQSNQRGIETKEVEGDPEEGEGQASIEPAWD